ncbi:MAG TPA: response regulator [Catenuloplanes sp.]
MSEALFAVIFVHALVAYLRGRDPLQRDVMVMFSAMAGLFTVALATRLLGELPELVGDVSAALLVGQPLLTLRVVRRLRAVPPRVYRAALAGWLASAVVLVAVPGQLPLTAVIPIIAVFVFTEVMAAVFLAGQAATRTGASRARLLTAALATGVFAAAIVAAGAGAGDPRAAAVAGQVAQGLALVSALGYMVAFAPPRWLRRVWSSRAAYALVRRLLDAPPGEAAEATWHRYAETVCAATGADAAVVLLCSPDEVVTEIARVSLPAMEFDADRPDGEHLLGLPRAGTVAVEEAVRHGNAALAVRYARLIDARFITQVPLPLHTGRGVLLLLDRYRNLFTDDDVQLLGDLAGQAAALAERGQLLSDREILTDQLSTSVTALRQASAAKSDFLANMSHELRTPLNAIIGFSDLMRTEPTVGDRSTVPTEWIRHINSSGRHLLGLINEVLDLAKIEAGQIELRPEPLDLPQLVGDVVATLQALSDRKRLEVTVAVPSLAVTADRMRFRQVVTNLLSNAIKFTPEGGRIFVAVRRLGSDVTLSVADTGPGIAVADQQRVFEEFQQAGEQGIRAEGTGLGLALTRRLVQAHGGRIEVESSPGHGAKFTVYLPAAPTLTQAVGDQPPERGCAGGILVIEDDVAAGSLLATYLEKAGYRVTVAATGEQGLASARTGKPEAILLDLQLPGMDGWQVLTELKADDRLRHTPVVIISVADQSEIGLALGAVDYFVKPINRADLLTWLARHGLIPPTSGQALNVLAIDDDPRSLEIIDSTLSAEGMRVVRATGGAEGLRLAHANDFNLIICDLLMPDVDGFDVIAALHSDPATRDTSVVVLSSHDPTEADKARLSGKVIAIMSKGQTTTGLPDLARVVGELTGLTTAGQPDLVP